MKGKREVGVPKAIKTMIYCNSYSVIWSFIAVLLFFGCQGNDEETNLLLNENEICFNEKLVSITKNGDKYYIGAESSGRIYVYLPEKNSVIDTLNMDCGRIYQVKQTNEANTFYVGTQNMGLKKTRKVGTNLSIETSYIIRGKGNRFSCYDVFIDEDAVYALTSHGIFKVGKSDTLDVVYAKYENGQPEPFVANNMVRKGNSLFAATAKGLVKITQNNSKKIIEKSINNVEYHDGHVYALGDVLYKLNDKGDVIESFELKASADYYYHTDSINYFLSDNYIVLTHDTTLNKHQPELYKKIYSRRKLSVEGHNVIADSKDYSLLIADNAVWQIGHHLPSVFGELKGGGSKLACTDGKNIYFLVGKKVYKLGQNFIAKEVLELREKGEINLMACSRDGDSLYYVNSDNEVLRQSFETPWYQFWPDKPDSIGKSKKEITAMCIHQSVSGVILGIRDGLIRMNKPNVTKKIILKLDSHIDDTIPYIRRFLAEEYIYVPTMNEGLFRGKGDTLSIVKGTESLHFIRDVATRYDFPYLLTNRYLYWGSDSIENTNYGSRLLILGDRIYIPGEVGGVRVIRFGKDNEIQSDTIRFPDVSFRAESSCVLNEVVYLGGQSGVIALNSNNGIANYVKFVDKTPFPFLLLLLFLSLIAIIFCFLLWLRERIITTRRRKKRIQEKAMKFKSWLDAIDDEKLKNQIFNFIELSSKNQAFKIIDDLENESESITSSVARFLQEDKKQAVRIGIDRQIERLHKRCEILESYMQENIDVAQILRNDVNAISERINNLKEVDNVNIQDAIDEISKEISDRFVLLSDNYWKEIHQVSLNGRIGKFLEQDVFSLLDNSLQSEIKRLKDEVDTLQNLDKEEKKAKSTDIGNRLDTITIKVTLTLRNKSEELKNEYQELVKNNGSKMEELNEEDSFSLSSEIDFYEKWIAVERDLEPYKFLFEEKIDANFPVEFNPVIYELHQTKMLRGILSNGNLNSHHKLDELNKALLENQEKILEEIVDHIDMRLTTLNKISMEEQDKGIVIRLKKVFEDLKIEAQFFSVKEVKKSIELINKITLNDGRLMMFNQLVKIREIAKHKNLSDNNKEELEKAVGMFYRPVFTYHVDMEIYNQLLECTKNERYSPKGNERGSYYVQQPFYILAIALAKCDNFKRKGENYTYFFPKTLKKDKKTGEEKMMGPDSSSISRAKGFVAKWVDSTFAKELKEQMDKNDNPLYASVLAFYLSRIASFEEGQ